MTGRTGNDAARSIALFVQLPSFGRIGFCRCLDICGVRTGRTHSQATCHQHAEQRSSHENLDLKIDWNILQIAPDYTIGVAIY